MPMSAATSPSPSCAPIMTPWSWSIAYRRFYQGVLIRFNRSKVVGIGTVVRLTTNFLVLATGYLISSIPGIVVGASAVAVGVVSEAIYIGIVVRPVVNLELKVAPPDKTPLTWHAFFAFYIPLALTSLLTLIANPIGSAALSRMPNALESLAVWPVVTGLIFILRSLGIAFNEVVVALMDELHSYAILKRFTNILSAGTTAILLLFAATPLSTFWFATLSALPPNLVKMAQLGLWIALPLPALSVVQSWYQGAILHGRRTSGITESVVIYLLTTSVILGAGIYWGTMTGLYVGLAAMTFSVLTQTAWLWNRSRPVIEAVKRRDSGSEVQKMSILVSDE